MLSLVIPRSNGSLPFLNLLLSKLSVLLRVTIVASHWGGTRVQVSVLVLGGVHCQLTLRWLPRTRLRVKSKRRLLMVLSVRAEPIRASLQRNLTRMARMTSHGHLGNLLSMGPPEGSNPRSPVHLLMKTFRRVICTKSGL